MSTKHLEKLILGASRQRILCLGDVMLDDFIYGTVERISPEAPVPVLKQERSEQMPGGAANTARNLAALGVKTRLISIVGNDAAGVKLTKLLTTYKNIDPHLHIDPDGTTTQKIRLVSGGQQLLRLDRDAENLSDHLDIPDVLEAIPEAAEGATAILVSDYAKGVVGPDLIAAVLQAGLKNKIPVIIDPKGADIARYGPVDLLKPNANELSAMVEMPTATDAEIEAALNMALELSTAKAILVTRAALGLSYLERGGSVRHCKGQARDVYDVSGAGDTVVAILGIALSAGASLSDAAELSLIASGLAVEKPGTAVLSPAELLATQANEPLDLQNLASEINNWRRAGHSVGFTNGCFDILHPGHLRVLEEAKARCGRLVVGLNSDASVSRLKGPNRPVNDQVSRARMLAGLSAVDGVVIFEEDTPAELINIIRPDLLVKGGDYSADTIIGADAVRAWGGEVYIAPLLDGFSTTHMLEKAGGED
jgi:D-beta-D-heptose 7-phosphate kinase/D-beta-D-heptose 1-phosphate adenosyltransferase